MIFLAVSFLIVVHIFLTFAIFSEIKTHNNWLPVPPYLAVSSVFLIIYIELFKYLF